jgi:hypothetical protein
VTHLGAALLADLDARVGRANAEVARRYPGDRVDRQPTSTVYVPADRVAADLAAQYGGEALRLLDAHAPDGAAVVAAFGLGDLGGGWDPDHLRAGVAAKLDREPIEDLRVDFEDGYGRRPDDEEDRDAARAGAALAAILAGPRPPWSCGARVESFADGLHRRSLRTLERFLAALLDDTGGVLPGGFVLTLPKITTPDHVALFAEALAALEGAAGLDAGALRFELQIETTQAVIAADGRIALPGLVAAGDGRVTAAHFGTYDYTAACGLPAAEQRLDHAACDHARHLMQVALAGRGVRVSDGSTNVVPAADTTAEVTAAWRTHARLVRRSLAHGFPQGWDLVPAHLPSRYAAVQAVHLAALEDAIPRVAAWTAGTTAAGVLDEPATITGLLTTLRRAIDCGATTATAVLAATALDPARLAR